MRLNCIEASSSSSSAELLLAIIEQYSYKCSHLLSYRCIGQWWQLHVSILFLYFLQQWSIPIPLFKFKIYKLFLRIYTYIHIIHIYVCVCVCVCVSMCVSMCVCVCVCVYECTYTIRWILISLFPKKLLNPNFIWWIQNESNVLHCYINWHLSTVDLVMQSPIDKV